AGSLPEPVYEPTPEQPHVTHPHAPQQPAGDQQERSGRPSRRPRPDWAEETPLDDLPTLADELLGDHDDEGPASPGRGRRPRR
ncbi:hypothetical protein, partial [Streptomyces sp. NPDC059814]|uniref:hypothetical protein n=1 Tax=Streptomyces sp. NPDC059814 TaxID=3346959 RepID=UPI00365CC334